MELQIFVRFVDVWQPNNQPFQSIHGYKYTISIFPAIRPTISPSPSYLSLACSSIPLDKYWLNWHTISVFCYVPSIFRNPTHYFSFSSLDCVLCVRALCAMSHDHTCSVHVLAIISISPLIFLIAFIEMHDMKKKKTKRDKKYIPKRTNNNKKFDNSLG